MIQSFLKSGEKTWQKNWWETGDLILGF